MQTQFSSSLLCRSLAEADQRGVAAAVQHHGKEMSYNNYLDADAAYGAVCDYAGACSYLLRGTIVATALRTTALISALWLLQLHTVTHNTHANSTAKPGSMGNQPGAECSNCASAEPTCVVVKHTNPCGIASREDLKEAYRLAVRADPISAFGGIVAFNRLLPLLGGTIAKPSGLAERPCCHGPHRTSSVIRAE